jgi:hypothetical protein
VRNHLRFFLSPGSWFGPVGGRNPLELRLLNVEAIGYVVQTLCFIAAALGDNPIVEAER